MLHCIVDDDDNENTEMKLYLCRRFIEEYSDNNSETDTEKESESEFDTDSDFEKDEKEINNLYVHFAGKIIK